MVQPAAYLCSSGPRVPVGHRRGPRSRGTALWLTPVFHRTGRGCRSSGRARTCLVQTVLTWPVEYLNTGTHHRSRSLCSSAPVETGPVCSPGVTRGCTIHIFNLNISPSLPYLEFIYEVFTVCRHLTAGLLQLRPVYLHSEGLCRLLRRPAIATLKAIS